MQFKLKQSDYVNIALVAAAIIFLAAYLYTPVIWFGVLSIISFIAFIALDFTKSSTNKRTSKSLLTEIAIAIGSALAAWLILSFLLSTPSPIDVVTSCSMKPMLERGDLILVQSMKDYSAPILNYTGEIPRISVQRSSCSIAKRGSPSTESQCTSTLLVFSQTQRFTIPISRANVTNNDIIVFEGRPRNLGLIVHRAVAALHNTETGETIYVTKGDNNQVADQEAGLDFVTKSAVHGRYIMRIPYVGYLRLFLAGQFSEPPGCDTVVDLGLTYSSPTRA